MSKGLTFVACHLLVEVSMYKDGDMVEHTARILSPTLPPELRYVTDRFLSVRVFDRSLCKDLPLRSVETPVANSPRDATANEPPRSTSRIVSERMVGV